MVASGSQGKDISLQMFFSVKWRLGNFGHQHFRSGTRPRPPSICLIHTGQIVISWWLFIQSVFSRIMSSFAASPFWSWGWSSTCFGAQTTLTTGWVASLKQVGSYFIVESGSRCWGGVSSRAGSRRRASHTFHMQGQKNFCKGKQDGRKRKEKQLNVILTGVRIPSCCWAWAGLGDHW